MKRLLIKHLLRSYKGGGVKLKLSSNVHNISLYKNKVFNAVACVLWLSYRATLRFHWLIMGKAKIGIYG